MTVGHGGAKGRKLSESEYTLTILVNRLRPELVNRGSGKTPLVFLLGAGCSKQYGLPSFQELLVSLWEDHLHVSPNEGISTEELRDGLERYWQALGPRDRHKVLERYLKRIDGRDCPGYLRLARLARDGYVKAFVNMNFDTLLEDALRSLGVNPQVSTTFQEVDSGLVVYKPHGSIGPVDHPQRRDGRSVQNDLVLDIAKGDLFASSEEQDHAQRLLTGSDVVMIGYSGVDAKIAMALRNFPPKEDPRNYQLFLVNPLPPDPRLQPALEERSSRDLLIVGKDGYFEGFMEELERALEEPPGRTDRRSDDEPQSSRLKWEVGTRAERVAFQECLQFSRILWAALNIQDNVSVDWEKHGHEVYGCCVDLAREAGICLTSPEKYVLQCAALLHDLGYFAAHQEERGADNPGWRLLRNHGELTAVLVKERLDPNPAQKKKIVPDSYGTESVEVIVETILSLCRHHAGVYWNREVPEAERGEARVAIAGCPVPLRRELLLALFSTAEELVVKQPLLAGSEIPLEAAAVLVEDAILDFFLRWKSREVVVTIRNRKVFYELKEPGGKMGRGLLAIAHRFVRRLDELSHPLGGCGLEIVHPRGGGYEVPYLKEGHSFGPLLTDALEESLGRSLKEIELKPVAEDLTRLDLIAMHTLRTDPREPRLSLDSEAVRSALERFEERALGNNLLQRYFAVRTRAHPTVLEKVFAESFENILYPAWRLFAKRWRNKSAIITNAIRCLDMGSSRFRPETVEGFPYLLEKIVLWDGDRAFAHDECTLCTSRLLYILAQGRLVMDGYLEKISGNSRGLNESVAGLLRYFLARKPEDASWWGLGSRTSHSMIHEPEYLAWSACGVAFVLSVERQLRDNGTDWLEGECRIRRSDVERLLQERGHQLFSARVEDLLGDRGELTHELALGYIGWASLELDLIRPEIQALIFQNETKAAFLSVLRDAWEHLGTRTLSLVNSLHLMPATLVLDGAFSDLAPETTPSLVSTYLRCAASPAWVKSGSETGAWGFDSKYAQPIFQSLVSFWRYAFREENRDRFEAAFAERLGV